MGDVPAPRPRRNGPFVIAGLALAAGGAVALVLPTILRVKQSRDRASAPITVVEPAEGAVIDSRNVSVSGRLQGRWDLLTVNGEEAPLRGETFAATVHASKDGPLEIEVKATGTGSRERTVTRRVEVDATAPVIEVTEPDERDSTVPDSQTFVRIRGRVIDAHLREILVFGKVVASSDGVFDTTLDVPEGATAIVEIAATDTAGNRSTATRRIRRERAAPLAETKTDVASFLSGWAAPEGKDVDSLTGYPIKIRRAKDSMRMVLILAGTFKMGAVPGDGEAEADERPRHEVTVTRAYYMDEHEVTNEQFDRFVSATEYRTAAEVGGKGYILDDEGNYKDTAGASWRTPLPGGKRQPDWVRHPVVLVSWDDARSYSDWVGAALPAEAQFERAIRDPHDGEKYPWGDELPAPKEAGNYRDGAFKGKFGAATKVMDGYEDGSERTSPVMSFRPDGHGLYDASGNVWEWCADWYDKAYYAKSLGRDPAGPDSGSSRVLRGGSWNDIPRNLRASGRYSAAPAFRSGDIGFRCVRSLP